MYFRGFGCGCVFVVVFVAGVVAPLFAHLSVLCVEMMVAAVDAVLVPLRTTSATRVLACVYPTERVWFIRWLLW